MRNRVRRHYYFLRHTGKRPVKAVRRQARSRLFKMARVLVGLDNIARVIVTLTAMTVGVLLCTRMKS